MSDTTKEIDGYQFNLEDAGAARKRLSITIEASVIDAKLGESMQTLQGQSQLPGFRKGHAPVKLLERRFGEALREDTRNELMNSACQQAFEHFGIKPLGELEPTDPDAEYTIQSGNPLSFSFEFEVVPDFDMPDIESITLDRPNLEVNDEQINEELERQCLRHGEAEERTGDFEAADRLLGRCELRLTDSDEEAPLFSHEQILIVLPEAGQPGQVLGLQIEDLLSSFTKASAGDEVVLTTTGPEGHEREDIRGKDLTLNYTIHLAERITPTTPEQIIEMFSLASEDVLREQLRLALEQQRDEEQANVLREQMTESLSQMVDMELPEKLSGQQIEADLNRIRMDLMQRGMEPDEVEDKIAEVRTRSEQQSRNHMKVWFVLERVAEEADINVSEQEINGRIAAMAMRRGVRPDTLRSELVKHDRIMPLARSIREQKATDSLVARATVNDVSMDEWKARVSAKKSDKA